MTEKGERQKFYGILKHAGGTTDTVNLSGLSDSRTAFACGLIAKERKGQILIVTSSQNRANRLGSDLSFFVKEKIVVIPDEERTFIHYDAKSRRILDERLEALSLMASGEDCIVVTSIFGAVKKIVGPELFKLNKIQLAIGSEMEQDELKRSLGFMGYERSDSVEAKGQYSIRGGILDIFPADSIYPYRVEFFDTEVDSIRTFDPETQRSIEGKNSLDIYPAEQLVIDDQAFNKAEDRIRRVYEEAEKKLPADRGARLADRKNQILECIETRTNIQFLENYIHYFFDETAYLWDYLAENGAVIMDDPDRIWEGLELADKERQEDFKTHLERGEAVPSDYDIFFSKDELKLLYKKHQTFIFTPFTKRIKGVEKLDHVVSLISKQPPVFSGRMDFLETELLRYKKLGYEITIVCSTDKRRENMEHFLAKCGLDGYASVEMGILSSGMEFPEDKVIIISDRDIFTTVKRKRTRKEEKSGAPIKSFTDIRKGDYIVHENHGIGKFLGIEQLEIQGVKKDYLKIKYSGEDMLYVPVEQMDIVQKYVGTDGPAPKINKLASGEWKKTKARAKAAIKDMARELLALSAARQLEKGFAFAADTIWQREFEDMFPYEETLDQLKCIKEIKKDMESDVAMDRLLCGDVGYGKTEVAARAVFKCAAEGKQAAILVPTTILCSQHYYTFVERFENFPFNIEMLCRFRSEKEQDKIIEKVGRGEIDVLIGTHRMLSKDVKFKDLGLLVIDEEQRFGVQHKEKIKNMRKNIDVLTLSATPIPRTLHMSLIGVRDMSIIEEPPEERYPVQTYVMEQDEEVMAEAIARELDRDGQVYVVYNRVRGIQKIASRIRELVPEAETAVAHGQMNEKQMEDIMVSFVNGEYKVLVATTIIESGIDIPNVNTIIIIDADKLGLSQLYQLRGRVGRSNRLAYAYLMYQKDKILPEHAEKRLRAIREFTEFGSGFKLAMRDLEIRGAGNLLGMEQHGHMMMIGYELYCKLVEDAVRELSGGKELPRAEMETSVEIDVEAIIPDSYISDELLKLQMYKKIASIETKEDQQEIIDELLDRFGDVPRQTLSLIDIAYIKSMAQKAGILRIYQEQKRLVYEFAERNNLEAERIGLLASDYGPEILIHGGVKPYIKCILKSDKKLAEAITFLTKLTT